MSASRRTAGAAHRPAPRAARGGSRPPLRRAGRARAAGRCRPAPRPGHRRRCAGSRTAAPPAARRRRRRRAASRPPAARRPGRSSPCPRSATSSPTSSSGGRREPCGCSTRTSAPNASTPASWRRARRQHHAGRGHRREWRPPAPPSTRWCRPAGRRPPVRRQARVTRSSRRRAAGVRRRQPSRCGPGRGPRRRGATGRAAGCPGSGSRPPGEPEEHPRRPACGRRRRSCRRWPRRGRPAARRRRPGSRPATASKRVLVELRRRRGTPRRSRRARGELLRGWWSAGRAPLRSRRRLDRGALPAACPLGGRPLSFSLAARRCLVAVRGRSDSSARPELGQQLVEDGLRGAVQPSAIRIRPDSAA